MEDYNIFLEELKKKIPTGNVLLFAGAGFSASAKNLEEQDLKVSRSLANYIAEIIEYEDEDEDEDAINDLRYMSDLLLDSSSGNVKKFIKKMKEEFCVTNTSQTQNIICSLPWRRFYTTNYDNSLQLACQKNRKIINIAKVNDNPDDIDNPYILHINGHIDDLNQETILDEFKLTHSSYVSTESFLKTKWEYVLSRDIEYAPAIVFLGYSLYDFEISSLLKNYGGQDRTYFVTRDDITKRRHHELSKYGRVLPINIEGFAEWIQKNERHLIQDENPILSCFRKYSYTANTQASFKDTDILNFLSLGRYKDGYIEEAIISDNKNSHIIGRDKIDSILLEIKDGKHILITSELGNGKSTYLQILAFSLGWKLGGEVYFAPKSLTEYDEPVSDIDILSRNGKVNYLIIDGYSTYLDLIKYFSTQKIDNIVLVMSSRVALHDKHVKSLQEYIDYSEYNIDVLSENEINSFIKIIDFIGFWGNLIKGSDSRSKLKYIKEQNKSIISSVLLGILNSENIKSKIGALVDPLLSDRNFKDIIFTICVFDLLDVKKDIFNITRILGNNDVFNSTIRNNENFQQLFDYDSKNNSFVTHSSIFSLNFILNHYEASYIINKLIEFVKYLDNNPSHDKDLESVKKQILRFSFIERIIPDEGKKGNLDRYYDLLKKEIDWIQYDPHYWLQYAMAQLTHSDRLDLAQTYLKNAYNLAKNKINYNTNSIDTQQARLYLRKSLEVDDSFELFSKAHTLLLNVPNDVYRYRQLQAYKDFYDIKYPTLIKKYRTQFEHACNRIIADIADYSSKNSYSHMINNVGNILNKILDDIKKDR